MENLNMGDAIYFLDLSYEVRTIMKNVKVPMEKALAFVRDKYELGETEYTMVKNMVEVYN